MCVCKGVCCYKRHIRGELIKLLIYFPLSNYGRGFWGRTSLWEITLLPFVYLWQILVMWPLWHQRSVIVPAVGTVTLYHGLCHSVIVPILLLSNPTSLLCLIKHPVVRRFGWCSQSFPGVHIYTKHLSHSFTKTLWIILLLRGEPETRDNLYTVDRVPVILIEKIFCQSFITGGWNVFQKGRDLKMFSSDVFWSM